jgi:hypothetical protein
MICLVSVVSLFVSALSCLVSFRFLFYNHPVKTGKIELNKFHASKKAPFYLVILPVKSILSDGIPQAFLPFRFDDIIVITVHDRFWNVGQANCILKYFENMMIDHSDSTIF